MAKLKSGNRVELQEVESVIREIDFIEDVTVQTIKHGTNNELVAYVVCEDLDNIEESVCDYIANNKPNYMVPSFVVRLDNIPLTVNGKVDKHNLPEVDDGSLRVEYVAPRNETEKEIVEAFEEVFNQEKISIYDDFVRLGGDSLTAIKINTILSNKMNDIMSILRNRTPYRIAQGLNENYDYGFELVKKGSKNQNMFILPPIGGVSFLLMNLVNNIDFEGNVYLIDDFKYSLTLDEIKDIENNHILTLNRYYDAIKDIFQDGDIIVGYSLGCIYALLIAEKLEKTKQINKCILIDGTLKFVKEKKSEKEDMDDFEDIDEELYEYVIERYSDEFKDKLIEIYYLNSYRDFHTPQIMSYILYLSTSNSFNEDLDNISDNYEFIYVDSTHENIIDKDVNKIKKYFK